MVGNGHGVVKSALLRPKSPLLPIFVVYDGEAVVGGEIQMGRKRDLDFVGSG